jgi:hypothetical protein
LPTRKFNFFIAARCTWRSGVRCGCAIHDVQIAKAAKDNFNDI